MQDIKNETPGSFVSRLNPITGLTQWNLVKSGYDFEQEIARSGYADMLHDTDRNIKYHKAICHAINYIKSMNKPVHVLDIGTGTGILSMMAVRAGADSVTACEAFLPVAKCAKRVIKNNGCSKQIRLLEKRSTDIVVGVDMPQRANILIAELFDTELIGEGALITYRHAADNLLTPDATLIPNKAHLYIQIVESSFLWSHHYIEPFSNVFNYPLSSFPTNEISSCSGCPTVFDIQASQLRLVKESKESSVDNNDDDVNIRCLLKKPLKIHTFNFSPPSSNIKLIEYSRLTAIDGEKIVAQISGSAHAFVVWWTLQMEPSNTTDPISIAPSWADEDGRSDWREHWMQAIFFPKQLINFTQGDSIRIDFTHDDISMWFDIPLNQSNIYKSIDRPFCACSAHIAWPRSRIAEINSFKYRRFLAYVSNSLTKQLLLSKYSKIILIIPSDASLLPLAILSVILNCSQLLIDKEIYLIHMDSSVISARLMKSIYNNLTLKPNLNIIILNCISELVSVLKLILSDKHSSFELCFLSEPFTLASLLPWNSINFWYIYSQILAKFPLVPCKLVFPLSLRVYAVAVDFEHLHKIRTEIGDNCEGFDLKHFDKLVLNASNNTDASVEPQPLWEYTGVARSEAVVVFELDLREAPLFSDNVHSAPKSCPRNQQHTSINLTNTSVNGMAFWVEWLIDESDQQWKSVAAPSRSIETNSIIKWSHKEPNNGVFLFTQKLKEEIKHTCAHSLCLTTGFDFSSGEMSFNVNL